MKELIAHSFEAGRRGKPDEFETSLAAYLTGAFLEVDKLARFDLRVNGTYSAEDKCPVINISGEVSDVIIGHHELIKREARRWYDSTYLDSKVVKVNIGLKRQSGVLNKNIASGDSGNPIAVAYANTERCLPWERFLAVSFRDIIDSTYKNNGRINATSSAYYGFNEIKGLRADGKVQVNALYDREKIVKITDVIISCEHEQHLGIDELRYKIERVVNLELKRYLTEDVYEKTNIVINPNGIWNKGGLQCDDGSREAKPYRDAFATHGVNEDSIAGEDPTKPSGTGTFLARWIANYICHNNLADFARVSLSYQIGNNDVGLNIWTDGTGRKDQEEIENIIRKEAKLDIGSTIERFGLRNPELYRTIAKDSDFFQNPGLPWNRF